MTASRNLAAEENRRAGVTPPALSRTVRLSYGVGSVAYGVKDNGFAYFLLLYYNQVLGLPERWVGFAILVALVADAVSDPLVGYFSDNWHSRFGRRHPFLYASAIPVAVSFFFLWNPPAGLTPESLFLYLLAMAIIVRTCITFYEIPSTSLVAELTPEYDERTSLLGLRYFFGWWGGLGLAVLAFAVILKPDAEHPSGLLNPAGYGRYGLVAAGLMTTAILLSALGTHSRIPWLKQPPPPRPFDLRRTARELRETLSNRNFLALFASAIFAAMAAGLAASLNFYFATFFWELTTNEMAIIILGVFFSAGAALVIAPRIGARLGKKRAAITVWVAALTLAPLPVLLRLAGLFPGNDSPALLPLLFVFNTIDVAFVIAASILVSSMVADVVEDSETTTGRRSEGIFFAARSFAQKCVSGVGIFLSTLLLAAVGFPAGAQPGKVDPAVVWNLGAAYGPTLILLYSIAVACLVGYRIGREEHAANLHRLSLRASV